MQQPYTVGMFMGSRFTELVIDCRKICRCPVRWAWNTTERPSAVNDASPSGPGEFVSRETLAPSASMT